MQNAVSWLYETDGMTDAVEMRSCGKRSDHAIFSPAWQSLSPNRSFQELLTVRGGKDLISSRERLMVFWRSCKSSCV